MEIDYLGSDTDISMPLPHNTQYREVIGSLLYLATVSRPDISTAVGILSCRVEKPTEQDRKAAKRVIRYLGVSTLDKKLYLPSTGKMKLECFVDADWAGDRTDRKSTSGYVFRLGDEIIAWSSKKQTSVTVSSTEAEYIAASHASKELLWLRQLLKDMSFPAEEPTIINEDNQGCIRLIESSRCGARTKHIDVCYHQIRDL
ncbi:Copia protein [Trachymyrmex zeteki]|uniref:Copia protein n=1 Tax=Mycetomoellerius zeteki TaxID=64791 RepID=A0A151WP85_9HYME|nr:Copia protein [Trachymyrmex zeteki]